MSPLPARDGGIHTYRGATFHGSYPGLPAEAREGTTRTFVSIEPRDDDLPGYMIRASGGDCTGSPELTVSPFR